ncbi:hypothetical protein CEXT_66791 [Caerostris extrusa]|uniref:Uncharacterized protein n=1 Tax=Caerostris extrusa TaxID=172846 RepID=A0AAV4MF73_CAEEX|nr:hypothetical protein CEXT_66791 [Caerostris extrusa]
MHDSRNFNGDRVTQSSIEVVGADHTETFLTVSGEANLGGNDYTRPNQVLLTTTLVVEEHPSLSLLKWVCIS